MQSRREDGNKSIRGSLLKNNNGDLGGCGRQEFIQSIITVAYHPSRHGTPVILGLSTMFQDVWTPINIPSSPNPEDEQL